MTEINKINQGDVRQGLKSIPDQFVNCCVTSPPYWGLRDYGTGKWDGGDPACSHSVGSQVQDNKAPGAITTGQRPGVDASKCKICGAIRIDDQVGLEKTPEEYVETMVELFRDVRRILKDDGTLWLNLGDSYANDTKWGGTTGGKHVSALHGEAIGRAKRNTGLKPKDLVGIPWRVAFALQSDGWYLRQDIIWAKLNPMPESVTDRCTKAHEYIFLLSKSPKYYYNNEAIKQPVAQSTIGRGPVDFGGAKGREYKSNISPDDPNYRAGSEQWGRTFDYKESCKNGVNKRSVWTVSTKPFAEAHFATFPEDLIVDCIKAGCPKDGIVLDPFMGAGTTALVARKLGRNYIGYELNPEYIKIAEARLSKELGMFK